MKKHAALLGFSFLLSKILGLIRDNLLAAKFGASAHGGTALFNLDSYYAAFRIPDLLFNLLSYGVLSAAFVPLFVEILKKESRDNAFRFANEILHTLGIIIIIISAALILLTGPLLKLFVPGFSPENFAVTVHLTRLMSITPIFFTIGAIASGIQNSFHAFWGLALAPIMYNLGIIGGILFFTNQYGVYGVAIGVGVGAFLNMAVQIPVIVRLGFRYQFPKRWWGPRIKEMITLSFPRILGMSVQQLSLIVDTVIASTLAAGSITIINFASNLESLPLGIIGISVAVVSFGTLAGFAADNRTADLAKEVSTNIRRILFLLIPLTAGIFLLREEIVKLLLEYGKFTSSDTAITADTLGIFLLGLSFAGIVFLLARAFYALKNTKTPVLVSITAVGINIALSLIFTKIFSFATYGLALANSIADIFNAVLLAILLSRRIKMPVIEGKEILKFLIATLVMGFAVAFGKQTFELWLPLKISLLAAGGSGIYFGIIWLLKKANFLQKDSGA